MDKFTNLDNKAKREEKKEKNAILFSNEHIKLVEYENWSILEGSDAVICIPILTDSRQVVLRQEYIPSYKKRDGHELYLNVISGTMEHETKEECLFRETKEEAGLVIRSNYNINFESPLYLNKGTNVQFHIAFVELSNNDYYETVATGDGSRDESLSKAIKINYNDIHRLKAVDLVTELVLTKLKQMI